ncbi:MAG: GumC family protein [Armatimonadota bacterium]
MEPTQDGLELRSLVAALRRRRRIVIQSFVVIVAVVALGTWLQTPVYEAKALLLVETTAPTYSGYEEMPVLSAALDISRARSVETHKRLVKSRPVLEKALAGLKLDGGTSALVRRVEVETLRDTDVLEVKAQHEDPRTAADIANAVATFYVEQSQAFSRQAARSAGSFLEGQIEQVRQGLRTAEDDLEEFKREHGIADLSEETRATIQHLAELQALQAEAEADARAAEERAAKTRSDLERQPVTEDYRRIVQSNPVVAALEEQLAQLEIERAGLLEDYTEESPEVRAAEARIARANAELGGQVETILGQMEERVNPVYQTLLTSTLVQGAEARALRKREGALLRRVREVAARLDGVPTEEAELARLTRAKQVGDSVYTLLLEKMHEVRLAESMQLSNARIWESASPPTRPVKPRKLVNMALAVVLGALVGLLLAALSEYLDDTISDPEEAKRTLDLPLMGVVPLVREEGERILTEASRRSALAEAYRLIRSNVGFAAVDKPIKTLLITSPSQMEGKSTTAANLAVIMAQQETRVILVDTDLRRPSLHGMLGADQERGLTNALVGEASVADVVQETAVENLRFVAAGPIPPNPAELLAARRMGEVLAELTQMADVVIFDSPPAAMVADAAILGAQLDASLLVLEQNVTRRPLAMTGKERLEAARATLVGTVLNKAVATPGDYYYYYYYYHYDYYGAEERAEATA